MSDSQGLTSEFSRWASEFYMCLSLGIEIINQTISWEFFEEIKITETKRQTLMRSVLDKFWSRRVKCKK